MCLEGVGEGREGEGGRRRGEGFKLRYSFEMKLGFNVVVSLHGTSYRVVEVRLLYLRPRIRRSTLPISSWGMESGYPIRPFAILRSRSRETRICPEVLICKDEGIPSWVSIYPYLSRRYTQVLYSSNGKMRC